MAGATLPPGFRFHPTDEELVGYYLKRKIEGLKFELEVIPVIDLYKFDPWELPDKSFLPKRDMEWFFFCPRDRKYPNGSRTNRATKAGYWKATGKDRKVVCQSTVIGFRKTLVFYRGRAPLGDRTDWVMHEYRLCDDLSQGSLSFQGAFALCRVMKKNEHAQKTSDLHGESKTKTVGCTSATGDSTSTRFSSELFNTSNQNLSRAAFLYNGSNYSSPVDSPHEISSMVDFEQTFTYTNPTSVLVSPDLILDSSKDYPQRQVPVSECFQSYEVQNSVTSWQTFDPTGISPSSSYSNFTEEVDLADDFSRIGCMSPYSGHVNYMGMCGNEEYEGYDQTDYPSINGFEAWNQAPICRQASGDGSLGELSSLWLQEDNLLVVM